LVLAKSPQPGRVKTRLSPTFTPREAAALASAAVRDTVDRACEASPRHSIVAWDGPSVTWLPDDVTVVAQRGDGLDERIEHAFAAEFMAFPDRPVLIVGMDTPQLSAALLTTSWQGADAVLGLSEDGGFWALGLKRSTPGAIRGIPMSTPHTGAAQLARLHQLGLRVAMLPVLRDVDTPADAEAVAALAPGTRFGRLHHRLIGTPCDPLDLFDAALAGVPVTVHLPGSSRGPGLPLALAEWLGMRAADDLLVARCEPPVLDLGCGPGRFVEALALQGIPVLGVDLSTQAVTQTWGRGGSALRRDFTQRLPAEGRWGTVLLADGNIGIGGSPGWMLSRCRSLLRSSGIALVEADADDESDSHTSVVLRAEHGRTSVVMPWARIGARPLVTLAARAGFVAVEQWHVDGRVFVALRQAG
jgi:rSAM/selenodomain-associated transferase 1